MKRQTAAGRGGLAALAGPAAGLGRTLRCERGPAPPLEPRTKRTGWGGVGPVLILSDSLPRMWLSDYALGHRVCRLLRRHRGQRQAMQRRANARRCGQIQIRPGSRLGRVSSSAITGTTAAPPNLLAGLPLPRSGQDALA